MGNHINKERRRLKKEQKKNALKYVKTQIRAVTNKRDIFKEMNDEIEQKKFEDIVKSIRDTFGCSLDYELKDMTDVIEFLRSTEVQASKRYLKENKDDK